MNLDLSYVAKQYFGMFLGPILPPIVAFIVGKTKKKEQPGTALKEQPDISLAAEMGATTQGVWSSRYSRPPRFGVE